MSNVSKLFLPGLLMILAACQAASTNGIETFTGFLIGETVDVSAEVGGRVATVAAQEGDVVQAGQSLVTLDDEMIKLRVEIADAIVAAAQAQVALLDAGARAEEIRRAEARVEQARAARDAATQALADTEAIRANPQMLAIARTQAETRAQAAQEQLIAAAQQAQAADLEHSLWEDQVRSMWAGVDITLPTGRTLHFDTPAQRLDYAQREWSKAGNNAWQAWGAVTQAQANLDAANAARQDVADQITNSIALDAKVNQARAARDRAIAALQTAEAALQILREGASSAQKDAARAALDQARAARATLDQEVKRHTIVAPRAGTVTRVFYRAGEVLAPTTPLVRLSIAGDLKLRVFVPMSALAKIQLNQQTTLVVPEQNNRAVSGSVTFIAERAEFAGRQAQTDNERNAQLGAVEVAVKNADGALKAGTPASVSFSGQPSAGISIPSLIKSDSPLTFSGTLEAKQTRIATELGGKVANVRVSRGDVVNAGDALVELDDTTVRANLSEAEATTRAAQANLDQVKESARPGALALADATVMQAQAELDAAQVASKDAERALASPQELNSQLHAAEGRALDAKGQLTRAQASLADLKVQVELAQRDGSMSGKYRLAILQKNQVAAQASLNAAQINVDGSARALDLYRAMLTNPLELIAAQHGAANQVKQAQAGLQVAQAEREMTRRGAQVEQIALADAKLRAAQAGVKLVQAQAKRHALVAPLAGTIIARDVQAGEMARPGAALVTIADTRELEMMVYIPIQQISAARVGQAAQIKTPTLPGKIFAAKVTFIASESEFKPANIYNSQERSEMVFAVRVTIPNASGELKAGLPADATLQ
ncbi:hypothetical protein ANRL1_04436 [Anaerolineae bacterium]|nr:hypothetical protein ANRL1_04436 [Anaerolineae bacterium]